MASSFTWDTSKFESPKEMEHKLDRAMLATVKYWAGPIETHMKHNAPWTDRTTNARNGLFAKAGRAAKHVFEIILGHSVDYGVYLENGTKFMAARPIIRPTMEEFAPRVMATFRKLLDRL